MSEPAGYDQRLQAVNRGRNVRLDNSEAAPQTGTSKGKAKLGTAQRSIL
jgi:hypothetical protein